MQKIKRAIKIIIVNALLVFIMFAIVEGSLAFLFKNQFLLQSIMLKYVRAYYVRFDRNIIQFLPECARYDSHLTYTLKPGRCRFFNREFDVEFQINSLGVRDDELSLIAPEIIVIGDSHAMGWGVHQDETFAQLIERKTGMMVLNAAISSYATVREMKILEPVDATNLKYLIIQYSENDYEENKQYYDNNSVLPIMNEEGYKRIVVKRRASQYYFGRHTIGFSSVVIKDFIKDFVKKIGLKKTVRQLNVEVEIFINSLINSKINLDSVNIIVFEVNGPVENEENDSYFINSLKNEISTGTYPDFIKNIIAVDFSTGLSEDKFFVLDGHITAHGHNFIAENLIKIMNF